MPEKKPDVDVAALERTAKTLAALPGALEELITEFAERLDPTQPPASPLAAKWAEILGELEAIPRNGHAKVEKNGVTQYEYDYVLESDLMAALRPKLAERGIAAFYRDEILSVVPVGERGQTATTVRVYLTLVDGETGERLELSADDVALDYGDKGARKAKTGAVRYLLLKGTLNPSDELDDPDQAADVVRDPAPTAKPETEQQQETRTTRRPTQTQREPRDVRLRQQIVKLATERDEIQARKPGETLGEIVATLGVDLDRLGEDALVAIGTALATHVQDQRAKAGAAGDVTPSDPFEFPAVKIDDAADGDDVPF